jgi:hypothetical protein
MERKNIELGPVQKTWIASLRANQERQMTSQLGIRTPNSTEYKACCLGEGGLIAGVCHWNDANVLVSNEHNFSLYLSHDSYKALGLHDQIGSKFPFNNEEESLAYYNDHGRRWIEIADMLESNPSDFFVKSK